MLFGCVRFRVGFILTRLGCCTVCLIWVFLFGSLFEWFIWCVAYVDLVDLCGLDWWFLGC